MPKRYVLTSEIDRVRAKHPEWELQLPDVHDEEAGIHYEGRIVKVLPASRFPDDVVQFSMTAPVRAARILLGDAYDHFKAAGGSASLLFQIAGENEGAESPGESGASASS